MLAKFEYEIRVSSHCACALSLQSSAIVNSRSQALAIVSSVAMLVRWAAIRAAHPQRESEPFTTSIVSMVPTVNGC